MRAECSAPRGIASFACTVSLCGSAHGEIQLAIEHDVRSLRGMGVLRLERVRRILPCIRLAKTLRFELLVQRFFVELHTSEIVVEFGLTLGLPH